MCIFSCLWGQACCEAGCGALSDEARGGRQRSDEARGGRQMAERNGENDAGLFYQLQVIKEYNTLNISSKLTRHAEEERSRSYMVTMHVTVI